MTNRIYNVLFLCTGNSARSIMAQSILSRLGAGRYRSFSAGSRPSGFVHPLALALLREHDYPTGALRSKNLDEFSDSAAVSLDFVFTLCDSAASESCPVWFGAPVRAHWGLADPALASGSEACRKRAFADTYRQLHERISAFVALPVATLDPTQLQQRLDGIGGLTVAGIDGRPARQAS